MDVLNHDFSEGIWFLKNVCFCALFWGFTNWTKMVHTVASQLKQNNKNKNLWKLYFSAGMCFCCKATEQLLLLGGANKNCAHCFFFVKMVLFEKPTGDVGKPLFFCKIFRFFVLPLLTLSFFFWLFVFWLVFFWRLIYFFMLLFNNSSFYVLAVVSVCFLGSLVSLFLLFSSLSFRKKNLFSPQRAF